LVRQHLKNTCDSPQDKDAREGLAVKLYDAPTDSCVEVILKQNIAGERCAIQRYQEIADYTDKKDWATHTIAVTILTEEVEHEKDLDDFIVDIELLKKALR
jgi:Protein distantly related to bacterial ferritins